MTPDEAISDMPYFSLFEVLTGPGPIGFLGWCSLAVVIVIGCILFIMSPRSGRRVPLADVLAACLHVQALIFILCVPLPLVATAYLTDSTWPYVVDAMVAAMSVVLNFTIGGVLLVSVSLRHKTTPTIEWLPAVSVIVALISVFAVWQFKMALRMWPWN